MKQLTCEMCGSTDLMKQDGVFICQSCGCKYSVEEAKRMMVEGTVDVKGTVKIDTSEKLENLYTLAKQAESSGNYQDAARYYHEIRLEDPNSWEAAFYELYFKVFDCGAEQIESATNLIINAIDTASDIIKTHVPEEMQGDACDRCLNDADFIGHSLLTALFRYRTIHRHDDYDYSCYYRRICCCAEIIEHIGTVAQKKFNDYELAQEIYSDAVRSFNWFAKGSEWEDRCREFIYNFKQKLRYIYWKEHAEEEAKLNNEKADLKKKIDVLNAQITAIDKRNAAKTDELSKERDKKLPCEVEVDKQRDLIRDLEVQRDKCGIFKGKEKKAIQARLDIEENPKLETLRKNADAEKKAHQERYNAEINAIKREGKELRDEVANLKKRVEDITEELFKDR